MQRNGVVNKRKICSEEVYELDILGSLVHKALEGAPPIEGYTIKQLAEITESPWPSTRWHPEPFQSPGAETWSIGRAKVYQLKLKKKKDN
jgi:hypothetical protein